MTRRHGSPAEAVGVVVYALVDWLVIMAPALSIELAANRGGIGETQGLDLLVASLVIATVHAGAAARRLRFEERTAERRADTWIANIDALVVLTLSTTLLVLVVLVSFPDEHAALANRGFPVVVPWAGLQLVGVVLAELTGRLVFRWLEPQARHQPMVVEDVAHAVERVARHEGPPTPTGDGSGADHAASGPRQGSPPG